MSQSQQQQVQQSAFTYFTQSTGSLLPFPQPPNFPRGIDPFAHSAQFTLNNVKFEAQTQYYVDPIAVSHSFITSKHADATKYNATSSLAILNSSSGNNWMTQSLANNVIGSIANQTMLIQALRCEVCNIDCITKDVYKEHLMGIPHQMNLLQHPTPAAFPGTSSTIENLSALGQMSNVVGKMIIGSSGVANAQELEKKKQKILNAGAAVDSVMMCNICKVACNSHEAFRKHLSGRRHAAQAGLVVANGVGPYLAAIRAKDHSWNKGKKTVKVSQPLWCELCKIHCNCSDAYAKHLTGKKHLKNLELLENSKNGIVGPSTPTTSNMITGSVQNQAANNNGIVNEQKLEKSLVLPEATKEDLEIKTRKVMEGGAAAAAVRVCRICNVVCNSQKVFNYHLIGQRHAAMVKKQADCRIAALTIDGKCTENP